MKESEECKLDGGMSFRWKAHSDREDSGGRRFNGESMEGFTEGRFLVLCGHDEAGMSLVGEV